MSARPALIAAGAACVVFVTSLGNDFAFDDVVVVRDSALAKQGSPAEIFAKPYWPESEASGVRPEVTYRPLTILSFRANHALSGGAFGFHLVNVLLHALAAAVVTALAARLTGCSRGGLVAGLLFAVHPVHTEAVAGLVGRAEVLAGALWAGALLAHVAAVRRSPAWIFLLGLGACLSKESAATLPAALALIAWVRRTRPRRAIADVLAAAAAAGVLLAARSAVLGAALDPGPAGTYWDGGDTAVRLRTAAVAFAMDLRLLVFPWRLSADYSFDQIPLATGWLDPRALLGAVLAVACVGFAVRGVVRRERSIISLGVALFLTALVPVANVLFRVNVILAERLLYLPSVGFCLAAGAWLGPRVRFHGVPAVVGGAVLLALGGRTLVRNPVWRDNPTLFEQTVCDAPRSAKAWAALGSVRAGQGRGEDAGDCFRRALAIRPDHYGALDGLGHLAMEAGRWSEALEYFRAAARTRPWDPAPLYNAGVVHDRGGNPRRAIAAFEAVLARHPDHAPSVAALAVAWERLAVFEAAAGRLESAEDALTEGLERIRALGGPTAELERVLVEVRAERAGRDPGTGSP